MSPVVSAAEETFAIGSGVLVVAGAYVGMWIGRLLGRKRSNEP